MSLTQVAGIGTAVPRGEITQADAAELAVAVCCTEKRQTRALHALYRRAGVRKRGSVLLNGPANGSVQQSFFLPPSDAAPRGPTTAARMKRYAADAGELAAAAARAALADAGRLEISHVVTVSCTGFSAPGVDLELIERLNLSPRTERVHVGFMGCHGAINGLRVAHALARTGAHVLLCAVELCSVHLQYRWTPDDLVANALFGDGAAALALVPGEDGPKHKQRGVWRLAATGSCVLPDSADAMRWEIGDHGFRMTLSPRVPSLIREHLRPWLTDWLHDNGLRLEEVGSWAVHPGGPRVLSVVTDALDLAPNATAVSREVLAEHGNMSSPTVLFILDRLRRENAPRPCVALAFGPGLTAEAALFR